VFRDEEAKTRLTQKTTTYFVSLYKFLKLQTTLEAAVRKRNKKNEKVLM